MPNMSLKKTPMPEQAAQVRNQNFQEVATGYTEEMAKEEAARCLNCKTKPCVAGCPVNVHIPEFIAAVQAGDYAGAYERITGTNALPAICGRVCPQETQCEARCVRGIKGEPVSIGRLERFVADWAMQQHQDAVPPVKGNRQKVAVIGSGPAGLACAGDLVRMGYDTTIFEAFHVAGGVLMYGIPEFRLPKEIVNKEIDRLKQLGVKIELNMVIGKILSIEELLEQGFEAVFVGSGAGLPNFMGIDGEELLGVYSANEFLTRINLMKGYISSYDTPLQRANAVAVVGGGNVAMDAARCAKRLGAEKVYIIYRRSESEMPARLEEIEHAKEEGIAFHLLTNPVRILGDERGFVRAVECVKMGLGEPDASGRRRPVEIKDSEHSIEVDSVVIAIGNSPNPLILATTEGLQANKKGCLIVDEATMQTTRSGIFAGGDAVTGAATVILAMGAGKQAAAAMDDFLRKKERQ